MAKAGTLKDLGHYLIDERGLGKTKMDKELLLAICDFIELDREGSNGILKINPLKQKKEEKI